MWSRSKLIYQQKDGLYFLSENLKGRERNYIERYPSEGVYIDFSSPKEFFSWMCNPEAAPNRDNALNIYVERNDLFSSLDIKRKSGSSKKDLKNFRTMMLREKSLEDNIVANISFLDSILGHRLEIIGRQYATTVGPIDILAKDRDNGKYVVIELKKGRSADRVYGQISRYIGWVRKNLAGGLTVDGVIVGNSIDDKLKSAVDAHDTDISLVVFDSKISGKKI